MSVQNKENVTIRLKPTTIEKLKKIAELKELRPTELMREVLESYVQMH